MPCVFITYEMIRDMRATLYMIGQLYQNVLMSVTVMFLPKKDIYQHNQTQEIGNTSREQPSCQYVSGSANPFVVVWLHNHK